MFLLRRTYLSGSVQWISKFSCDLTELGMVNNNFIHKTGPRSTVGHSGHPCLRNTVGNTDKVKTSLQRPLLTPRLRITETLVVLSYIICPKIFLIYFTSSDIQCSFNIRVYLKKLNTLSSVIWFFRQIYI